MGIHYVVIFLSHTKAYRFWRTLWLITNGCIMDHQVTAVILSAVVLRTTGYLTLNLLYQGCHKILTKRCRKDIAIFFNWKKSKVTMFIVILNNNSYRHWRFRTFKSFFSLSTSLTYYKPFVALFSFQVCLLFSLQFPVVEHTL